MIVSNPFKPDYRVLKEANSLVKNGFDVTIVAWDREAKYPVYEEINNIKIERIRVKASYGTGFLKLNATLLFWLKAIKKIKQKDAIIHCHDLDTLLVGTLLKLFYKKKLVYDSHENFSQMMKMSTPGFITGIVKLYEIILIKFFVDLVIVASSKLGNEFKKKTKSPVVIIGNWHDLPQIDMKLIQQIRKKYIKNAKILITYIGSLDPSRAIIPMIQTVKFEKDVRFLICGNGTQRRAIVDAVYKVDNVDYIGEIPLAMVPVYTAASDVIYYVMNENSPIANYNAPNSLGFALVTGRPLIASDNGELGRVVREANCGILVKNSKIESLHTAICSVRDENQLSELSKNALKAGKSYYNWLKMEQFLIAAYHQLLST